jgi:hypothetical protein
MFQTKVVEKLEAHILFLIKFFENCAVYEIMWKNVAERGRPHDNMAYAHCMLGNYGYKHTHAGCVIIIAFPLQQWLHERSPMLHYTYIASCLNLGRLPYPERWKLA